MRRAVDEQDGRALRRVPVRAQEEAQVGLVRRRDPMLRGRPHRRSPGSAVTIEGNAHINAMPTRKMPTTGQAAA